MSKNDAGGLIEGRAYVRAKDARGQLEIPRDTLVDSRGVKAEIPHGIFAPV